MKKVFALFLALPLLAISCSKTNLPATTVVQPAPTFHIYSPDGRPIDPSVLKPNFGGSVGYAYDNPGQWSVTINQKASDAEGEKLYTIPTQAEINDNKKYGVIIQKVSVGGSDAYIWQGLEDFSSLDMSKDGVDIRILSSKPLDSKILIQIAQSLK